VNPRRPFLQLPPLWARWVLALIVAAAIIAAIVITIDRAGPEGGGAASEAGAELETNRVADIAITEDEAPRSTALAAGSQPIPALERAIAGDVRRRIAGGQLTGPLDGVSCSAAGAGSAGRSPYRCTVRSAEIAYPFVAVVDSRRQRLTWCKVDQQPKGEVSAEIPLSRSCLA
jgi:hypothetical protein